MAARADAATGLPSRHAPILPAVGTSNNGKSGMSPFAPLLLPASFLDLAFQGANLLAVSQVP